MDSETNALRPYDGVPEVGERVWWEPPAHVTGRGWYAVLRVTGYEDEVWLKDGDAPARSAFCHELWREPE